MQMCQEKLEGVIVVGGLSTNSQVIGQVYGRAVKYNGKDDFDVTIPKAKPSTKGGREEDTKMLLASVNPGERQFKLVKLVVCIAICAWPAPHFFLQTIPQSIEYQMKNPRNYARHVSNRTSGINLELDLTKFQLWQYRLG
jgi:hypothetical protein